MFHSIASNFRWVECKTCCTILKMHWTRKNGDNWLCHSNTCQASNLASRSWSRYNWGFTFAGLSSRPLAPFRRRQLLLLQCHDPKFNIINHHRSSSSNNRRRLQTEAGRFSWLIVTSSFPFRSTSPRCLESRIQPQRLWLFKSQLTPFSREAQPVSSCSRCLLRASLSRSPYRTQGRLPSSCKLRSTRLSRSMPDQTHPFWLVLSASIFNAVEKSLYWWKLYDLAHLASLKI